MVLPVVAVCGLYALGGSVASMLATGGVTHLLKSDAEKLKEMEVEYDNKVFEISEMRLRSQADSLRVEIEILKLELLKVSIELEVQETKTRFTKK